MTRKPGALRYDNAPDVITRPDIRPGALQYATNSGAASRSEPRISRDEPSYQVAPIRFDEPTVAYAALQRVPTDSPRGSEERPASLRTTKRRSGSRHRVASTTPPPSRVRRKGDPAASDSARSDEPVSGVASPPVAPPAKGRVFLLGAVTALAAAALGVGLGNGEFMRAAERLQASVSETEQAAPVVSPLRAPPRDTAASAVAASPPPVVTPEASRVPVVRFTELLPAEQEAESSEAPSPPRKRAVTRRRR